MKHMLLFLGVGVLFSGCVVMTPNPNYTLTVNNKNCLTTATVFLDGKNSGTIPGGGVKNFSLSAGKHLWNVDTDVLTFQGDTEILMDSDKTVTVKGCL